MYKTLYMANKLKELHVQNIDLDQQCGCRFPRKKDNIYKRNPEMTLKTLAQDCVYSNPLKLNYIHTCLNRNSKNTRGCCGTN